MARQEAEAAEMLKRYPDGPDGTFNYKKLLQDTKRNSENEYKKIAELAHSYEIKDPETHKTVQNWLISTRRNIAKLDKELERLETGGNAKRRRKESALNKAVRLAHQEEASRDFNKKKLANSLSNDFFS